MIPSILYTLGVPSTSVLPTLLEKARAETTASVFVPWQETVYQLIVGQVEQDYDPAQLIEQFQINATTKAALFNIKLTKKQLEYARVPQGIIAQIEPTINSIIHHLFKKSVADPYGKHEAGIELTSQCSAFLHLKKNNTVSITIRQFFSEGSFKIITLVSKFGFGQKQYIEATPIESRRAVEYEGKMIQKLVHPCIVEGGSPFNKIVPVWKKGLFPWSSADWKTTSFYGFKEKFYELGSAIGLILTLPTSSQECLKRCWIVYDVSLGLSYIHSLTLKGSHQHLAHMDVKPGNIFLTKGKDRTHGVIGDINPKSEGEVTVSTLAYAAPETVSDFYSLDDSFASLKNDVWSLGVCFLEFIYGASANPFRKGHYEKQSTDSETFHLYFKPKLNRLLSSHPSNRPINEIISSMLSYSPAKRPTMPEVSKRLLNCIEELSKQA